jgi:transcriptional regulator GlxA family with amidase domain
MPLSMESNIENPRSLENLADELGVSLRHLERLFKRDLNTTRRSTT